MANFLNAPGMRANSQTTAAPSVTGFGSLTLVANTSTLLNTVTLGPNSAAWPTIPGLMYVINQGSGTIYVAPLGGTASSSTCVPIAAGTAYGFNQPSTSMTCISTGTPTVTVQW